MLSTNTLTALLLISVSYTQNLFADSPTTTETYCAAANSNGYKNIRSETMSYDLNGQPDVKISVWNLHLPGQMTYIKSIRTHQTDAETAQQYTTETAEWPNGVFCTKENDNPPVCQKKSPNPEHSLYHEFPDLPTFMIPHQDTNLPLTIPGQFLNNASTPNHQDMAPIAQMLSSMATFMNMPIRDFMVLMMNMMKTASGSE